MNKIFFITFASFMILGFFEASAQEGQHKHFDREAFSAKRNAYITAEVGLTPEEAAAFIPLCDEMQQKMFEAGRTCRKLSRELKAMKKPSDADYMRLTDECIDLNIKRAELEKEYYGKFKKVLSPEKIYKYRRAEYKFARDFMKRDDKGREGDIKKDIKKR